MFMETVMPVLTEEKKEIKKKYLTSLDGVDLSFVNVREYERTKHVHRLHPYKGKFIPQLVQYFLDSHIDDFKKEVYFQKEAIILDPFWGSGTTIIQSFEMDIHFVGAGYHY